MSSELKSFIYVAVDSPFPIQNLPYGVFRLNSSSKPRIGVAIGNLILDLYLLAKEGLLGEEHKNESSCFQQEKLNGFMYLGKDFWKETRKNLQELLSEKVPTLRDDFDLRAKAFYEMNNVIMDVPATIGDYTDFYSSKYHAENVGTMFRGKQNALPTNWLHLPIAYHGRSSSIVISGTDIIRPKGQIISSDSKTPEYKETQILDFELEVGFFIGKGNELGKKIDISEAKNHIFGLVLVNDWSARDIQKWEYVPLGPFLGKNFATSISPWIVTLEALEPFLIPSIKQEVEVLSYLREENPQTYDIHLQASLLPEGEKEASVICETNFNNLYWTMPQQVSHHTINGCNLRTGDLIASGTISGKDETNYGSLLELSWGGTKDVELNKSSKQRRKYLEDGDEVVLSGFGQADGYRIGFGECRGKIVSCLP